MHRFLVLSLIGLVFAAVASVAHAKTVEDIDQAWRDWMAANGRRTGGLAVVHGGRVVHEAAIGREKVGAVVPLASLSKAVTGVCIAGLVDRGRLSFDTPLSQALVRTFKRVGPPADPRLAEVTLAQLLVHRAGFDRADGGDPATGSLGTWLRRATATRPSFDKQTRWVLQRKLPLAPGERYAYTNAAYLLLGQVIEEASGQDYESYCRTTALAPFGVRGAALDPAWRILASYGGWQMPLADYGRFYQAFASDNPALGPAARHWMNSPEGKSVGGGAYYALGTLVRPARTGGGNFLHWGSWTFNLNPAFDGPMHISYSTFAVRLGAPDVNMVVYMDGVPAKGGAARNDLDRALGAAARAVKRWP